MHKTNPRLIYILRVTLLYRRAHLLRFLTLVSVCGVVVAVFVPGARPEGGQ